MPKSVRVEGFPPACSKKKAELFLEKTASEQHVTWRKLQSYATYADIVFAREDDAGRFISNLPKFSFGGKEHDLKTFVLIDQQDTCSDEIYHDAPPDISLPSLPSMLSLHSEQYQEEFFDCNRSTGEDTSFLEQAVFEFSKAHTWFDLERFPECNQSALLVQTHHAEIGRQQLLEYFEKVSMGGPIKRMVLMIDGVLIIFHNTKTAEKILDMKTVHQIEGKPIKIFLKVIPELFKDKLMLKNESEDSLPEEEMKMEIANLSQNSTEPDKIELSDVKDVSIVSYKEPLDEDDFRSVVQKAKEREIDESSKILTVPKSDCIIVEGLREDIDLKRLRIRLENKSFSDGAVITRMDRCKSGPVLVYFASFKHAENVLKLHVDGITAWDCQLTIKPYFHCFSNIHRQLKNDHLLDIYCKTLLDREVAPMSFLHNAEEKHVLKFLSTRQRHLEGLKKELTDVADVEIIPNAEKHDLKVTPISPRVAKDQVEFKELCQGTLQKFFAQFSTKTHKTFNVDNLEKVRIAAVHPNLNSDGVDNPEHDYLIRWSGNKNEILHVTGIASELETIVQNIVSLTDITNQSLSLTKGKYLWAVASGEIARLTKSSQLHIKTDDANHTLNFTGSKLTNSEAHVQILKSVEPIKSEKFETQYAERNRFLVNPKYMQRVVEHVNAKLSDFKATLTVEKNIPFLWCHEEKMNEAITALRKLISTDKTIQLSATEIDATKLSLWSRDATQMQEKYLVEISIEGVTLVIVGFCDHIAEVKKKIKTFLDEHTERKITFKISYGKAEYIVKFCNDFKNCRELKAIEYGVEYGPPCEIYLKGKRTPVEKVLGIVKAQNILEEMRKWEYFGILDYCSEGEGKSFVQGSPDKCVIIQEGSFPETIVESSVDPSDEEEHSDKLTMDDGEWEPLEEEVPFTLPNIQSKMETKPAVKKLSWTVCRGDITANQSDAIVNCVGNSFSLKDGGLVCGAILTKGGATIQSELDQSKDSRVRVTKSGGLPSKFIIHAYFTNDAATIKMRLQEVLKKAEEKKCQSLGIPAIGTGNMRMPVADVANLMRDAFEEFQSTNKIHFLEKINVVIFDQKLLPTFEKVLDGPDQVFKQLHASSSTQSSVVSQSGPGNNGGQLSPKSLTMGPFTINVKKGDITEEKSIAIVNSVGNDFDLSQAGMVSKQILKKGGDGIQKELSKISGNEIRVTSGGKLPCQKIIHVVFANTEDVIRKLLEKIILKAEEEKCDSLSIPALGTGGLSQSSSSIAKLFRESFSTFVSKNANTRCLKTINVVIFDEPMFADFVAELIASKSGNGQASQRKMLSTFYRFQNIRRLREQIVRMEVDTARPPPAKTDTRPHSMRSRIDVRMAELEEEALSYSAARRSNSPSQASSPGSVSVGPVSLTVRIGDITEEKSDAIVNSIGSDFELSQGQVSNHIVRKGGDIIRTELALAIGSDIRVTSAGKMACKKILHVVFPQNPNEMKKSVKNVLCKAEEEKCQSLSFPAIGTGNLKQPSGEIAKQIRMAITEFASEYPTTKHLKQVDIVIFEDSKYADFFNEIITPLQGVATKAKIPTAATVQHPTARRKKRTKWKSRFDSIGYAQKTAAHSSAVLSDEKREFIKTSTNSVQIGQLKVTVKRGDITDEKSDAIVNSTGSSFDLSNGLVSRRIVKIGGEKIQDELTMVPGREIRTTTGGKLPCGKIIHTVAPNTKEAMKKCIKSVLRKADDEKCTTLSIPAIGTGNRSFPSGAIAGLTHQGLVEFVQEHSVKHLKSVNFVIFDQRYYPDFLRGLITDHQGTDPKKKPTDPNSTTLFFYSAKKKYIDKAVKTIGDHFKSVFGKKTLTVENLDDVMRWKSNDLDEILSKGNIGFSINRDAGKIALAGQNRNITATEHKIDRLSSEVGSAVHLQSFALFSWKYCNTKDQWIDLGPFANKTVEEAYANKKQKCDRIQLLIDGKQLECTADLENMNVLCKDLTKTFELAIRRDVKEEFPRHWEEMGENDLYKQVQLNPSDQEYKRVEQKFRETVPLCTIHSVCRIQNKKLYLRFQQERRRVQKICSVKEIERVLFHGTSAEIGDKIANEGFDRGYAGANAVVYGNGVYFAKNASYSNRSTYAKPNSQNVKTMLVANVITGDFCVGKQGMKSAPRKQNSDVELYNCAVDNFQNPTIFVVFVDAGAYPEYMLKYTC